jgi:hypothetical protein
MPFKDARQERELKLSTSEWEDVMCAMGGFIWEVKHQFPTIPDADPAKERFATLYKKMSDALGYHL